MRDSPKLEQLIRPSLWAALAGSAMLALGLALLWQGAGASLMVVLTASASFPIMLLFSFLALTISKTHVFIKLIPLPRFLMLGLLFAGIGFVLANNLAYFEGTLAAFLASGLAAGIAANKSLNANTGKVDAG